MGRQETHHKSCQTRLENTKYSNTLDFLWGIPDATSLFLGYGVHSVHILDRCVKIRLNTSYIDCIC